MSDASIVAEANKLRKDPRIDTLLGDVLTAVKETLIDDAIAIRRKVMGDLYDHATDDKARLGDRLKALEMMGRAIGMFTDKTETKTEAIDSASLKRELDEELKRMDERKRKQIH